MSITSSLIQNVEEDDNTKQYKLQIICILSFLSQYPVSEAYFKSYTVESTNHWTSLFYVDGTWNQSKFIQFFQDLENFSLGSWITCADETIFEFRTTAQEFRCSTFTKDQQRKGIIEAIHLLSDHIKNSPRSSWSAKTNTRLIGHIDACLNAKANLFGDSEQGITKERNPARWLAQFYQEMGRYQDAEYLYFLTLGVDYDVEHDPETQWQLESLGVLLDCQGKHEEAEIVLREVLSSKIALHGKDDVECLRTRENLANCLRNQEKFDLAEQHYLYLMEEHPDPWFSLRNNCALLYWARDRLSEAYNVFLSLLTDSQSTFGGSHDDTLMAQHNLGTLCLELGKYEEARLHLQEAFTGRKKRFGWIHPHSLMSAKNLAIAELELKNHETAEKLLDEALKVTQTHRSENDDLSFDLVGSFAMLAVSRGQLKQARSLLEENFAKSVTYRGSKNPKTLRILHDLACVLEAEGVADTTNSE